MSSSLAYGLSATGAVLQLGFLCVAGFIFGRFPRPDGLLTQPALAEISSQVYWLYTPCLLVATFGANLTAEVFVDSLGLLLWSLLHMAVNLGLGVAVARAAKVERAFRASFLLAAVFNNGGNVPLVLMAGITATAENFADDPSAYSRAVVAIWIYLLPWNISFYSAGLLYMQSEARALGIRPPGHAGDDDGDDESDGGAAVVHAHPSRLAFAATTARRVLATPPMIGIGIGMVVGLVTPLRTALFVRGAPLQSLGDVVAMLGTPCVPLSNLVLAGALFHGVMDLRARRRAVAAGRALAAATLAARTGSAAALGVGMPPSAGGGGGGLTIRRPRSSDDHGGDVGGNGGDDNSATASASAWAVSGRVHAAAVGRVRHDRESSARSVDAGGAGDVRGSVGAGSSGGVGATSRPAAVGGGRRSDHHDDGVDGEDDGADDADGGVRKSLTPRPRGAAPPAPPPAVARGVATALASSTDVRPPPRFAPPVESDGRVRPAEAAFAGVDDDGDADGVGDTGGGSGATAPVPLDTAHHSGRVSGASSAPQPHRVRARSGDGGGAAALMGWGGSPHATATLTLMSDGSVVVGAPAPATVRHRRGPTHDSSGGGGAAADAGLTPRHHDDHHAAHVLSPLHGRLPQRTADAVAAALRDAAAQAPPQHEALAALARGADFNVSDVHAAVSAARRSRANSRLAALHDAVPFMPVDAMMHDEGGLRRTVSMTLERRRVAELLRRRRGGSNAASDDADGDDDIVPVAAAAADDAAAAAVAAAVAEMWRGSASSAVSVPGHGAPPRARRPHSRSVASAPETGAPAVTGAPGTAGAAAGAAAGAWGEPGGRPPQAHPRTRSVGDSSATAVDIGLFPPLAGGRARGAVVGSATAAGGGGGPALRRARSAGGGGLPTIMSANALDTMAPADEDEGDDDDGGAYPCEDGGGGGGGAERGDLEEGLGLGWGGPPPGYRGGGSGGGGGGGGGRGGGDPHVGADVTGGGGGGKSPLHVSAVDAGAATPSAGVTGWARGGAAGSAVGGGSAGSGSTGGGGVGVGGSASSSGPLIAQVAGQAAVPGAAAAAMTGRGAHGASESPLPAVALLVPAGDAARGLPHAPLAHATSETPLRATPTGTDATPHDGAAGTAARRAGSGGPGAGGAGSGGISLRTIAALCATRLVLSPAVLFGLFIAAERLRVPVLAPGPGAQDPVLRLLVLVEAIVPSAQSVLLLCQLTNQTRAASDLSLAYLVMYPASLLTMMVGLAAAMGVVFG